MFSEVIQPQYGVPQILSSSHVISLHDLVNELASINTFPLQLQRSSANAGWPGVPWM